MYESITGLFTIMLTCPNQSITGHFPIILSQMSIFWDQSHDLSHNVPMYVCMLLKLN